MSLKDAPNKACTPSPTKHVGAVVWDSAAISNIFPASGFSWSQTESQPAPAAGNASRWALTGTYFWKEKRVSEIF